MTGRTIPRALVLVGTAIIRRLLRAGVLLGPMVLLTVRGRTTGQARTTPVGLFEKAGRRWLVATHGEGSWVRNLRAAGEGTLSRGRRRQAVTAAELTPEAAGPVLKEVVGPRLASPLRGFVLRRTLEVAPDAPLDDFIGAARRHPVFELGSPREPSSPMQARGGREPRVTPELVLSQLRHHDFAVLSTANRAGQPHSAGVTYGVSRPGRPLAIYVMTRRHLRKARDVAENPNVSLVVPLTRRWLWFLPPATIQLRGRAEIFDWTHEPGVEVFRRSWLGRRILAAYRKAHRRGESRICFLKITPEPRVRTYMVGVGLREISRRMESGAAQVSIPPELP